MQAGARDSNPARLARALISDQDAGNIAAISISEDIDSVNLPRRLMIELISIISSLANSYIFRIYTQAGRCRDPGNSEFSLLYQETVTSSAYTEIAATIPYVDEDADANEYSSEAESGEYRGQLHLEIVSSTGVDTDYAINVAFRQ